MMATTTNSAIASPAQEAQMTTSESKFQDEFRAGVTAVLRSWSALKTAVTNEWGGPGSKEKATELRGHILSAFEQQQQTSKSGTMDQYELEDNLLLYMEEEFSIVLEDDSEKQLAFTICQMFENSYQKNDYTLCRRMVSLAEHIRQQEEGGGGVSQKAQVIDQDDDDDDSSMVDEDDDNHHSNTMDSSVQTPATTNDKNGAKTTFDEESFITGTLNSSANLLVPVSDEIVQLYADLTNPLFGTNTKKPTKDIPPPRQLGEDLEPMLDDQENNMMDDDGFITVKPKNNRRR